MRPSYYILTLIICSLLCIQCKEEVAKPKVHVTGVDAVDILTAELEKTPMDADLYYQRAQSYIDNSAYELAILDLNNAVQLDSLNPNYYHLLSDAYMDHYQSKLSLATMMKVGLMYPERTATQLKLAETQLILKRYDHAVSTINGVIKYDQLNAEAYYLLGIAFYEKESFEAATNSFLTSVENDPELIDSWFMLAQIAEKQNDPQAKRYYENALRAKPKSVQALHSLAYYLQNHDDIPAAQRLYRQIHVIDKDYVQANLNSGILYLEVDSLTKAFEQFNIMVENNPGYHMGYYYRGVVNELNGDLTQAMTDYKNCSRIMPNFKKAEKAIAALEKKLD